MKFILLVLAILLAGCGMCNAKEYRFPPELEELIDKYAGTEKPTLPEHELIEQLDDKVSVAPGKLPMTRNIIINKRLTRLFVVNQFGDTLASFPVCCSSNRGQKQKADDCRTPEGTFSIAGVYNSTDWRYKKVGAKCYGPFFISLITPGFYGIGIHGTNAPGSIPGRRSHGCIRMHNEDIVKVKAMVDKDTRITILPDDPEKERIESAKIRAAYVKPFGYTDAIVR